MDPFRSRTDVPPDPPEEQAASEPPEEPWMDLARLYRRRWLASGYVLCGSLLLLMAPVYFLFLFGAWASSEPSLLVAAVVIELVHALIYRVSPIAARSWARDAAGEASWDTGVGGWLVCGPRPRWPWWAMLASPAVSSLVLVNGFVLGRVVYFIAWASWCSSVANQVGLLRWVKDEHGKRVMELAGLDGCRRVELEGIDFDELRLVDRGQKVTWSAISPLDTLVRDTKKSTFRNL